jgi:NfeD-like C-terminal, partner-binding
VTGMIGKVVEIKKWDKNQGRVLFHGELWRAVCDVPLPVGGKGVIVDVAGLTLTVKPLETVNSAWMTSWIRRPILMPENDSVRRRWTPGWKKVVLISFDAYFYWEPSLKTIERLITVLRTSSKCSHTPMAAPLFQGLVLFLNATRIFKMACRR